MRPLISVVVPTIAGREKFYERCVAQYRERSWADIEIVPMYGFDCCGKAWNAGARLAKGNYLHFTADDLEPHPHWDKAAIEVDGRGGVPSPALYHPNGALYFANGPTTVLPADWTPGADHDLFCTTYVPFCSRAQYEQIGPTIEAHYATDDYFSWRARRAGIPIVFRAPYAFTHHHAMPGRGAGMDEFERHMYDTKILQAAIAAE